MKVTFADVAGVDEAKDELHEIVDFLKRPEEFTGWARISRAASCWSGPPGTGKTLLARAVAGEAGVPFYSTNGAEFVEMFVGVGAARVRDLFEQARKTAPCIIFIDELDALGRARGAQPDGGAGREGADAQPVAGGDGRVRPVGGDRRCWRRPTGRRSWTRRCCGPGGSTARCWWTGRTRRGGWTSCAST